MTGPLQKPPIREEGLAQVLRKPPETRRVSYRLMDIPRDWRGTSGRICRS